MYVCIHMHITYIYIYIYIYMLFLSLEFMIHRTTGERGAYPFHSSVPIPPTSQTLRH